MEIILSFPQDKENIPLNELIHCDFGMERLDDRLCANCKKIKHIRSDHKYSHPPGRIDHYAKASRVHQQQTRESKYTSRLSN